MPTSKEILVRNDRFEILLFIMYTDVIEIQLETDEYDERFVCRTNFARLRHSENVIIVIAVPINQTYRYKRRP